MSVLSGYICFTGFPECGLTALRQSIRNESITLSNLIQAMKRFLLLLTLAATWAVPMAKASDIRIMGAWSFYYSGSYYYKSSGSYSIMYPSGLGAGYYRYGSMTGKLGNYSSYRSGSVAGNLMVANYWGATTAYVTHSAGWGANPSNVFYANQSWTCTRNGYRKKLNRYGYPVFAAYEWNGSYWANRSRSFGNPYNLY